MEGSTQELSGIFKLKIRHFYCIHILISLYISITTNICTRSIYFTAITCEMTLEGLISSDQKHIDVDRACTVLSKMIL